MFTAQTKMKTLSALAILSILSFSSAQAEIIAVSGNASFEGSALGKDLTPGSYEQDDVVFGFNERQCFESEAPVDYLINEGNIGTPLPGGVITDPELTLPDSDGYASHIIHFDPVSTTINLVRGKAEGALAVNATFEFDNDIVAVIVNSTSLALGDDKFGFRSTTYSTGTYRGFEANDFFTINSSTSLTVNGVRSVGGRIDNLRVITANPDCD